MPDFRPFYAERAAISDALTHAAERLNPAGYLNGYVSHDVLGKVSATIRREASRVTALQIPEEEPTPASAPDEQPVADVEWLRIHDAQRLLASATQDLHSLSNWASQVTTRFGTLAGDVLTEPGRELTRLRSSVAALTHFRASAAKEAQRQHHRHQALLAEVSALAEIWQAAARQQDDAVLLVGVAGDMLDSAITRAAR